jgi:murein DD-endopeptidase MepM/ murein hydrolase activator NlpD
MIPAVHWTRLQAELVMRVTRRAVLAAIAGLPLAWPRRATALELDGNLTQGGLVMGQAVTGGRITLDGQSIPIADDGRFLLGFGRDAQPAALLIIKGPDGKAEIRELAIAQRDYEIQRIDNLPQDKVEPDEAALQRIAQEQTRINAARDRLTGEPFYLAGFAWPAIGPISGVYGSQRILNGEPRRPHFGVDVAAPAGTPIKAPAGGIVSLADSDLFFTGGTAMIDHGQGLGSIFAHMQSLSVKEGDRLSPGQPIGELGATGRATGPHMHWGIYLLRTPLDPQLLVPPMPA